MSNLIVDIRLPPRSRRLSVRKCRFKGQGYTLVLRLGTPEVGQGLGVLVYRNGQTIMRP